MGATDSEEIGRAIREANDRADVKAVMLNIDSPGDTGAGAPELANANAVASLNEHKPVLHQGSTRALACRMGRPRRIHRVVWSLRDEWTRPPRFHSASMTRLGSGSGHSPNPPTHRNFLIGSVCFSICPG
jgi:hypothetical protein